LLYFLYIAGVHSFPLGGNCTFRGGNKNFYGNKRYCYQCHFRHR